jgi:hypothetical protein
MNVPRILITLCLLLLAQLSILAQTSAPENPVQHNNPLGRLEVPDSKEQRRFVEEHSINNPSFNRRLMEGAGVEDAPAVQGSKQVRVIYLVPSDKSVNPSYQTAIANAISSLQVFYRDQMGGGLAFSLHSPSVETYQTPHPSSYYSTGVNARAGGFYESVLADGFALTGGGFNDPKNRWLFFIDADLICGQYTGGTSGIALMPANDLRGLTNQPTVPICPGDPSGVVGVNRWIGGLGHELGHACNLPHPPGCDNGNCTGGQFAYNSLMYIGYAHYPNTYLLNENKTLLQAGGFFHVLTLDPAAQYEISGRIANSDQSALSGVTLTLKETQTTIVSDVNGNFRFTALPSGGNYTVSASKPGYNFASPNVLFNNLDRNQTVNFTGTLVSASTPVLMMEENTAFALAFDSVTQMRGPFNPTTPFNFSVDGRTRVSLFAWQLELQPNEDISAVKVEAIDELGTPYTLTVEAVATVPGFDWLKQVVVVLPKEVVAPSNLRLRISLRGVTSNQGLIQIAAP